MSCLLSFAFRPIPTAYPYQRDRLLRRAAGPALSSAPVFCTTNRLWPTRSCSSPLLHSTRQVSSSCLVWIPCVITVPCQRIDMCQSRQITASVHLITPQVLSSAWLPITALVGPLLVYHYVCRLSVKLFFIVIGNFGHSSPGKQKKRNKGQSRKALKPHLKWSAGMIVACLCFFGLTIHFIVIYLESFLQHHCR